MSNVNTVRIFRWRLRSIPGSDDGSMTYRQLRRMRYGGSAAAILVPI